MLEILRTKSQDLYGFSRSSQEVSTEAKPVSEAQTSILRQIREILKSSEFQQKIKKGQITFAMIKPNLRITNSDLTDEEVAEQLKKDIALESPRVNGLEIIFELPLPFTFERVESFYAGVKDKLLNLPAAQVNDHHFPNRWEMFKYIMAQGMATFLILHSPQGNAVNKWRQLIGPTFPSLIPSDESWKLRSRFTDLNNGIHGSDSIDSVHEEIKWFASQLEQITKDI